MMFEWLLGTTWLMAPEGAAAPAPSGGDGGQPGGEGAAPTTGGEAHPTSTKPDDGGGDDPDAFQFLDQEGAEEGDEPAKQEPAPQDTSSPQQEGQPKPAEPQPKPGEPQKPQAPQPGEEPKPGEPQPAAREQPPADDGSPESVLKAFEEGREAIVEQLAEQRFSMTQEEVDAFQEDPGKFLPRFAAEAYLDAVRTSISYMQQIVPQLALRSVQLHTASSAAAESFFSQFPDLRAHAPQVEQVAKALRQTHPQMPQDEFQRRLGVTARAALGLQQPQAQGNGQGAKITPAPPFAPASASAPAHQQVPAGSDNPWDSINEALLNPEE